MRYRAIIWTALIGIGYTAGCHLLEPGTQNPPANATLPFNAKIVVDTSAYIVPSTNQDSAFVFEISGINFRYYNEIELVFFSWCGGVDLHVYNNTTQAWDELACSMKGIVCKCWCPQKTGRLLSLYSSDIGNYLSNGKLVVRGPGGAELRDYVGEEPLTIRAVRLAAAYEPIQLGVEENRRWVRSMAHDGANLWVTWQNNTLLKLS